MHTYLTFFYCIKFRALAIKKHFDKKKVIKFEIGSSLTKSLRFEFKRKFGSTFHNVSQFLNPKLQFLNFELFDSSLLYI